MLPLVWGSNPRQDNAWRKTLRRGLAVLGAVVVTGAVLEAGLRIAGYGDAATSPYRFVTVERRRAETEDGGFLVPDARLFWRIRAGRGRPGHGIGTRGFRTPEFAATNPPGRWRIACLGDSSVFGLGVASEETWPRVAEALLRARDRERRAEVLNLGVPGYTSWQGRLLLADPVAAWRPDVVMLAFGSFNDWVPVVETPDRELGKPPDGLRILRLVGAALSALGRRGDAFDEAQDVSLLDTASYTGPRRVPPDAFAADLRAMHRSAADAGAQVVLVALPLPKATLKRNPIALEYAERTRDVARDEGIPLIDGWKVFGVTGRGDDALFADFCHPSPAGHALLAAEAARVLGGL
jgi:lysophospholipase L1-like esterase